MSEQARDKSALSASKQMKASAKSLNQVAKALKQLSGISLVLNRNLKRSGKHLRSLLDFDQINRLNAPLKGAKKSSSRRRRSRRSSARRRSTARRSGNLNGAQKLLKGLGKLLGQVWKQLQKFFQSRKWTVPKGFERLAKAAKKLGEQLKGALHWGYEKILKPLAEWTMDEAVPAVVEALAKALEFVSKVLEILAPVGQAVWEHFLSPLASFAGDLVVGAISAVGDAFEFLTGVLEGAQTVGQKLGEFWDGLREKAGALAEGIGSLFQFDPAGWLEEHITKPLSQFEPLLTLKLALTEGPADLWKSFCKLWEDNPAVKTLVTLVQDGWKTVSDWVKEHIGGGVSKVIALAKDGWKSVSEWVKDHLGGAVNKAVGLARDGWSSVGAWVKDHLGSSVSKAVGLARDGWSTVGSWVKEKLGSGINLAVHLAKGWKGTVARALGLGNLWTKFHIKLPKVSVSWYGSPVKLPHFSVKWNAKGGILEGAQLFGLAGNSLLGGGERGREAVLPLESNTGWMDRIADKVASRVGGGAAGGSGQPIVVKVELDGRVIAESTIREWKRQARSGRYPLSELV
jgi:hypothetical protein